MHRCMAGWYIYRCSGVCQRVKARFKSSFTLALMNIGVELERAGRKKEAVEFLEKARVPTI
jgi:hypothetical protein